MSLIIPDEILQATGMSEPELRQEIAVLLFQKEKPHFETSQPVGRNGPVAVPTSIS
jgi:hypothetical protein